MDEASSKFVDQIATEKLLDLKLRKVTHVPTKIYTPKKYNLDQKELEDLFKTSEVFSQINLKQGAFSFPSCITTEYSENNRVHCQYFQSDRARGEVIFVHGLYEDNRQIYQYLISTLNQQGLNVTLYTLPFHYERKPMESAFSGEYFLSAEIFQSLLAIKQAVYDLYFLYRYIQETRQQKVILLGFSMGGGVSILLSQLYKELDGLFVINPVVRVAELIWERPLCSTIKQGLINAGIEYHQLKRIMLRFEPLEMPYSAINTSKIRLAKGIYDQINDPKDYNRFAKRWNIKNVLSYKAGHLNILRVPRLCTDIQDFYFKDINHYNNGGVSDYELL